MPCPLSRCRVPHRRKLKRFIKRQRQRSRGKELAGEKESKARRCGRCGMVTNTHTARSCFRALGVLADAYHADMAARSGNARTSKKKRSAAGVCKAGKRQCSGGGAAKATAVAQPAGNPVVVRAVATASPAAAVVGICTGGHNLQAGINHDAFVWLPSAGGRWAAYCENCDEALPREDVAACVLCQEAYCFACRPKVAKSVAKKQHAIDVSFAKAVDAAISARHAEGAPQLGRNSGALVDGLAPSVLAGRVSAMLRADSQLFVPCPWDASGAAAVATEQHSALLSPTRVGAQAQLRPGVYVRFHPPYWSGMICTGRVCRKLPKAPRGQVPGAPYWEVQFRDGPWYLPENDILKVGELLDDATIGDIPKND